MRRLKTKINGKKKRQETETKIEVAWKMLSN
jgi:hypothetical protein